MKLPKEAKQITLAVLRMPELHWKSCYEDASGRPEFDCTCPLADLISKIEIAEET